MFLRAETRSLATLIMIIIRTVVYHYRLVTRETTLSNGDG